MSSPHLIPLGVVLYPSGHHVAAWADPRTPANAAVDPQHYIRSARQAEAAKLDFVFVSDRLGIPDAAPDALARVDEWSHGFEALTLTAALAAATSRIGLIATASTSFTEPYFLARQIASLDLISAGRAGWNLVTSSLPAEALNFSPSLSFDHATRYERAEEFLDVLLGLWDSWEESAFVRDRDSGLVFDPARLHKLDHDGKYFRSRGPLNVPPSAQKRPVIVQAGSSDPGIRLAARAGEIVFTAQPDLAKAKLFRAEIKARARTFGRSAEDVLVLPGIFPVVGRTETEAREIFEELQSRISPQVGLSLLETYLGDVDLSGADLDGPLPPLPESNSIKSRQGLLVALATRENLTIRQLIKRIAGARGHWQVVGTAQSIADQMEEWVREGAADGFAVLPPTFPQGLSAFVNEVVPELRRRGRVREDYAGATLREHLGLARPLSRHSPETLRHSA